MRDDWYYSPAEREEQQRQAAEAQRIADYIARFPQTICTDPACKECQWFRDEREERLNHPKPEPIPRGVYPRARPKTRKIPIPTWRPKPKQPAKLRGIEAVFRSLFATYGILPPQPKPAQILLLPDWTLTAMLDYAATLGEETEEARRAYLIRLLPWGGLYQREPREFHPDDCPCPSCDENRWDALLREQPYHWRRSAHHWAYDTRVGVSTGHVPIDYSRHSDRY